MTRIPPSNHQMIGELSQQYQDRIEYLKRKIEDQQEEITILQNQINILTSGKIYDV